MDTVRELEKVPHLFMTKSLNKIDIQGTYLTTIKEI